MSEAESRWSSAEIDDYELTLQIGCFCPLAGAFDVTVEGGQVIEITTDGAVIDAPGGVTPNDWFTVEGLFDSVRQDLDPHRVHVNYSEQGYPTSIDIDRGEADDYLIILVDLNPTSRRLWALAAIQRR